MSLSYWKIINLFRKLENAAALAVDFIFSFRYFLRKIQLQFTLINYEQRK